MMSGVRNNPHSLAAVNSPVSFMNQNIKVTVFTESVTS